MIRKSEDLPEICCNDPRGAGFVAQESEDEKGNPRIDFRSVRGFFNELMITTQPQIHTDERR